MKFDAKKIRKLLNIIKESEKKDSLEAVGNGFVAKTEEGLTYTVLGRRENGFLVKYYTLSGEMRKEIIPFEKFKKMFEKKKTKGKKEKEKGKVVTDD
jgi:hypothetical protein